jgi:6-phosphogluconate dehydrogenase (decarboxylating)
MQFRKIGLGPRGLTMVHRLVAADHDFLIYDVSPNPVLARA